MILVGIILEIKCLFNVNYGMNVFTQGTILSNFTDYYIKIYNRCSPFWIGFYFGINYSEYKNKIAAHAKNKTQSFQQKFSSHVNTIEEERIENYNFNFIQKIFFTLRQAKSFSIMTFISSLLLMFLIIFVVYFSYDKEVPFYISFSYNFFSRKLFSLAFIMFCFSLLNGHMKKITNMMSNKIFNLPSKLSFAIYLCHPCVIKFSYYSTKSSFYLDFYFIFLFGIGFCVISTIYAFFLYLFFESPFLNFKYERNHYTNQRSCILKNIKISPNHYLQEECGAFHKINNNISNYETDKSIHNMNSNETS